MNYDDQVGQPISLNDQGGPQRDMGSVPGAMFASRQQGEQESASLSTRHAHAAGAT